MYPGESQSLNPEAPEVVKIIDIEKGWNEGGNAAGFRGFAATGECVPALWCARTNLVFPAGEIPAPIRGTAASPGIESWV